MKVYKCKLIMIKDKEIEVDNLNHPSLIHDFLKDKMELHKEPEEVLLMLALDSKNKVNCCYEVARGTLDSAVVSPREVFKRALVSNAKSIIIAHNHPSGNVIPSEQDKIATAKLKKAGEVLDIKLLDHIIISDKDYYSFYENNVNLIEEEESIKYYTQGYESKQNFERS